MDGRHGLIGTNFHGVALRAYCGGGAYGEVYCGEDATGRKLAVKIVSKSRIGDHWERELKGVVNYRRITENAPELLKIFHVEETGDIFYYTMEAADPAAAEGDYAPDTLAGRLTYGPLPDGDLFTILAAIFAGIETIHAAGFAHRDIKPENILFVRGVPKLGDLGLLSSLSGSMTRLAGTLDYMPPEMRSSGSDEEDRASRCRSDLYAFGKVIYCAVTGCSSGDWPRVPAGLAATLPVKLFLRLALRLCDTDPVRRLDRIEAVRKEFAGIERKLLCGETFRDRCAGCGQEMLVSLKSSLHHLGHGLRRYWPLVLTALVLLGGGDWYLRRKYAAEPRKEWSKPFECQPAGVSLTIPMHWELLSRDVIQQKLPSLSNDPDLTEQQKRQLEIFRILFEHQPNLSLITCDLDEQMADTITIQTFPPEAGKRRDRSDEALREEIQLTARLTGQEAKIESIRRHEMAGCPCLDIVYVTSVSNQRIRALTFELEDRRIEIALSAKLTETYPVRKREFDAVLETLKIRKKL